jgi:hypothetical protein
MVPASVIGESAPPQNTALELLVSKKVVGDEVDVKSYTEVVHFSSLQ